MVFSSLQFVLLFMPAFFAIYYLVPDKYKNHILLAGSLCFYAVGTIHQPLHFLIFLACIIADYFLGKQMEQRPTKKHLFLAAGITFHLLCLGYFKYAGFLMAEFGRLTGSTIIFPQILLPIGISFYTFQGISYLADIYRGTIKAEQSLLNFAVYLSQFCQLIAGPIVTYPQIEEDLHSRHLQTKAIQEGIGIFIFGLGLKVLLANPIGKLWTDVGTIGFESISTPLAWMAIIAYSLQLYFDFFGYSLMAIGLGKMLGFSLPKNFDHPYLSLTMTEFWRRWHMTLGSWFREYVYIPLGGSHRGSIITFRNLFIVWLLTGGWHGAGYNFVLWGFTLFVIIGLEKWFFGDALSKHPAVGHLYMALLIPLTWAIFAIEDMGQLEIFFSRLFPSSPEEVWSVFAGDYIKYAKLYWPFFLAGLWLCTKQPYRLLAKLKNNTLFTWGLLAIILIASLYCMYRGFDDPFLYFRF